MLRFGVAMPDTRPRISSKRCDVMEGRSCTGVGIDGNVNDEDEVKSVLCSAVFNPKTPPTCGSPAILSNGPTLREACQDLSQLS
eukprot:m.147128 g.147128  ORF g.147128 m.147128 type:complete len:84 (+) comp16251_c0_seq1:2942-3193(+)